MSAHCEVAAKRVTGSSMSLFERYLALLVGLCIVAGIALGDWFPMPFKAVGQMEVPVMLSVIQIVNRTKGWYGFR